MSNDGSKNLITTKSNLKILLADDDSDDCDLFKTALDELKVNANLIIVNNGEQLITTLKKSEAHYDIVFMDLNMPRKNGFECLLEIKVVNCCRACP